MAISLLGIIVGLLAFIVTILLSEVLSLKRKYELLNRSQVALIHLLAELEQKRHEA